MSEQDIVFDLQIFEKMRKSPSVIIERIGMGQRSLSKSWQVRYDHSIAFALQYFCDTYPRL